MEEFRGLIVRPCYGPGTRKPQARALQSSEPQGPTKHPLRQLGMVTIPPSARYPWVLPPSHFYLLWSEYKCPCCRQPPRKPSQQPSKLQEIKTVTRKWGVGWNFPVEFWFWTLFGSIKYHQIPDSWNPAPIPTPGAPDQRDSMYIGAALKKTEVRVHTQTTGPLEGSVHLF